MPRDKHAGLLLKLPRGHETLQPVTAQQCVLMTACADRVAGRTVVPAACTQPAAEKQARLQVLKDAGVQALGCECAPEASVDQGARAHEDAAPLGRVMHHPQLQPGLVSVQPWHAAEPLQAASQLPHRCTRQPLHAAAAARGWGMP